MSTETGTSAEVRELAGKTAAVLRDRGWTQGTQCDGRGRVCVGAARAVADGGEPDFMYDRKYMNDPLFVAIVDRIPPDPNAADFWSARTRMIEWQDSDGRTEASVLGLLDDIAAGR